MNKVDVIKKLMVKCQSESSEAKYIVRALQGKLRIGTADQTVLVGLAHAFADIQTPPATATVPALEEEGEEEDEGEEEEGEVDNKATEKEDGKEHEEEGGIDDSVTAPLSQLIEKIPERPTPEAVKLQKLLQSASSTNKAVAAAVYPLAEIAIKRAYSECPNLSLLIQSLLKNPLYNLFRTCRLTLGVPVSPM